MSLKNLAKKEQELENENIFIFSVDKSQDNGKKKKIYYFSGTILQLRKKLCDRTKTKNSRPRKG